MTDLSRARIEAVDGARQVDDVLGMADHLRDALWRVESANLAPHDAPGGLVVAGMGGSAIGGALASAALGDRASRPIVAVRDYALPAWVGAGTTVLCASYSGNTEETLGAYEAAGAVGARRIVATTGGALADAARADGVPVIPLPAMFQPRVAVGYLLVVALEVAALAGVAPSLRAEVEAAAARLEGLVGDWGPDGPEDALPKQLARTLRGTVAQIVGAGLTVPVAYRWKTQLNENAKVPAFAAELPEIGHNEIVGWEGAPELGRFSAVFLDDVELHPRVQQRIDVTCDVIGDAAASVSRVAGVGETRLERLVSLVLLGDLVSLYVAVLRGVDPTPVTAIERLKAVLADR